MMQATFDLWAEMTSPLDSECDGEIRCGQPIWIWAAAGQVSFVASYAHRATRFFLFMVRPKRRWRHWSIQGNFTSVG